MPLDHHLDAFPGLASFLQSFAELQVILIGIHCANSFLVLELLSTPPPAFLQNLLQCETEGADDEKVGFYGRCMLHATDPRYQPKYDPVDEIGSLEEKEFTCARTEVSTSFSDIFGTYLELSEWSCECSLIFLVIDLKCS